MYRRAKYGILFILLIIVFPLQGYAASIDLKDYQNDAVSILFIYSNDSGESTPSVKKIDLLLHHFTSHVEIQAHSDISTDAFKQATHVVYYGEDEGELGTELITNLASFSGPIIAIGENVEQIPSFPGLGDKGTIDITAIGKMNSVGSDSDLDYPISVKQVASSDAMQPILYGTSLAGPVPVFIQVAETYFGLGSDLNNVYENYLAEVFHDVFPNDHAAEHVAYIRLEDIHPRTDPEKLLEVGTYLNERDIPYVLVVIPVYITPETGKQVYFKDNPELVDVLQQLQRTNGTVIAHGYTHQYRDTETGEGFEFWDVVHNQFITETNPSAPVETLLPVETFPSNEAYNAYVAPFQETEHDYINHRLLQSIHELTSYGLHPLAFEAPHYTMSQQGYGIVANYFSALFGQVQLSDQNWENMGAPPYISTASFLHGMELFPETIGFVDDSTAHPMMDIEAKIEKSRIVRDSMISGFYHPYLGLAYLPDLIDAIESVPGVQWLDVKQTNQITETGRVRVESDGNGDVTTVRDVSWWDDFKRQHPMSALEKVLWVITIIVLLFVCLFFLFMIYMRTQVRKQLFKERKSIG